MSSLSLIRTQGKSREAAERRSLERKRDILVVVLRYLCDCGYTESYQRLCSEANLSLAKLDVADNIDLTTIFRDFEEGYESKYGKRPKFTRRPSGGEPAPQPGNKANRTRSLDSVANTYKQLGKSHNRGESTSGRPLEDAGASNRNDRAIDSGEASTGVQESVENTIEVNGFGISQRRDENVTPKEEGDPEEALRLRLLKPLPDTLQGELRDLAHTLTRDIHIESPEVRWEDIAGLETAKKLLKEAVVMPMRFPEYFTGILTPWRGVLLHGPPGTGKTMLAKAVATECRTTFFNISASTIISKWRGDSEKLVRVLFEMARHYSPSTIFMDEVDALMKSRGSDGEHEASRRMKTELLIQLDGLGRSSEQVFVLTATNLPWELDAALLRRLEKKIFVPLPCPESREAIFRAAISDRVPADFSMKDLGSLTEGFSGSDVALLAKEAAMRPLRKLMASLTCLSDETGTNTTPRELDPVSEEDVLAALQVTKASSNQNQHKYNAFNEKYGQSGDTRE
ncbi:hypothetical protein BSKO_06623 [Bryopsis sp. KO-2023]|nr:hypothetical protein BSKO_06623 [Bryopsis sp. KO-2023]